MTESLGSYINIRHLEVRTKSVDNKFNLILSFRIIYIFLKSFFFSHVQDLIEFSVCLLLLHIPEMESLSFFCYVYWFR